MAISSRGAWGSSFSVQFDVNRIKTAPTGKTDKNIKTCAQFRLKQLRCGPKPSRQSKYQMQRSVSFDVVILEGLLVHQFTSTIDEALLVNWRSLLVFELCFNAANCVLRLNQKHRRLAGQCGDEDLHL